MTDLASFEAVRLIRRLAEQEHSEALTQLAGRIAFIMRSGAAVGNDPFAKVKDLITNMIASLEKDAGADATHKAYCDKEGAETVAKKTSKTMEIEKLSTQIDGMNAKSAKLKEEVAERQAALADLAKTQAEMTKMRHAEASQFTKNKADMEAGIEGVKMALNVLRDYYAENDKDHAAASGSAEGIVGLLEVVESDFTKTFAEMKVAESSAQQEYDKTTRSNEIEKAT